MADSFDAYYKWLGIPPKEQPPHHYRLLAIQVFEQDRDVIAIAADRQMAHLRTFQSGPQSELSQRLLNEVSSARLCLLDAGAKAAYDAQLKARLKPAAKASGAKKTAVKSATSPATEPPGSDRSVWPVDALPPEFHRAGGKGAKSMTAAVKNATKQKSAPARRAKNQSQAIVAAVLVGMTILGAAVYFVLANKQPPTTAKNSAAKNTTGKNPPVQGKQSLGTRNDPNSKSPDDQELPSDFQKIIRQPAVPASSPAMEPTEPAAPIPDPTQPPLEEREAELERYTRGEVVDLLSLIDVTRDAVHGEWRRDGDALISPGASCSRIQIPYNIPDEYELTAVVERVSGDSCFNIGLVVGNSNALAVLDGVRGVSGLDLIDGQRYPETSTVFQGPVMNDARPHTFVCAVRRRAVRVSCDGKLLFHWVGDPQRLSLYPEFQMPDPKLLSITDYQASFRITRYELCPLLPPE